MEYVGILDVPPLRFVLLSVVQTFTLFVAFLLGLKIVGRRVFGEKGPQDLVILVLIAEENTDLRPTITSPLLYWREMEQYPEWWARTPSRGEKNSGTGQLVWKFS